MAETFAPAARSEPDQDATTSAFLRALSQLGHAVLIVEGERIIDASELFSRLVGYSRDDYSAWSRSLSSAPPDEPAPACATS